MSKYFKISGLLFLFSSIILHSVLLVPIASADSNYQYIERVFEMNVSTTNRVGFTADIDHEDIDRWFGSEYADTFYNEGAFRAPTIGYKCEGQDNFGPICQAYFILAPRESTDEFTRFINYCHVYTTDQEREAKCGHYTAETLNVREITIATEDYKNGIMRGRLFGPSGGSDVSTPENALEIPQNAEGGSDPNESCETGGGRLGWILCPILGLAGSFLHWVEGEIVGLLVMDRENYTNEGIRSVWALLRNLAFVILIPMMLVMVISTALGFEFVSAYTVKTALPRMAIAIIFIALSFDIMVFLIDMVQTIGSGIQNLLLGPFNGEPYYLTSASRLEDILMGSSEVQGLQTTAAMISIYGVGAFLAGTAAVSAWAGGGILSFILGILGSGALVLFIIFLLLTFRHMILIILLIVAPLAILPWIFPGRDKMFKLWNKTFWLMLWFYPIVMMTITIGKILAAITMR